MSSVSAWVRLWLWLCGVFFYSFVSPPVLAAHRNVRVCAAFFLLLFGRVAFGLGRTADVLLFLANRVLFVLPSVACVLLMDVKRSRATELLEQRGGDTGDGLPQHDRV